MGRSGRIAPTRVGTPVRPAHSQSPYRPPLRVCRQYAVKTCAEAALQLVTHFALAKAVPREVGWAPAPTRRGGPKKHHSVPGIKRRPCSLSPSRYPKLVILPPPPADCIRSTLCIYNNMNTPGRVGRTAQRAGRLSVSSSRVQATR